MEQDDDPERRIAELERMRTQPPPYPPAPQPAWPQAQSWPQQQGWQQPPPYPPARQPAWQQPQAFPQPLQSGPPPPRLRGRVRAAFSSIIFAVVFLGFAGFAAHAIYGYSVGKPTTARVVSCHSSGKSRNCTATWTIDGTTQTGKLDSADKNLRTGSTLDVRVYDGTAYTTRSLTEWLWPAAFFVGIRLLSVIGWRRKRRRST